MSIIKRYVSFRAATSGSHCAGFRCNPIHTPAHVRVLFKFRITKIGAKDVRKRTLIDNSIKVNIRPRKVIRDVGIVKPKSFKILFLKNSISFVIITKLH